MKKALIVAGVTYLAGVAFVGWQLRGNPYTDKREALLWPFYFAKAPKAFIQAVKESLS